METSFSTSAGRSNTVKCHVNVNDNVMLCCGVQRWFLLLWTIAPFYTFNSLCTFLNNRCPFMLAKSLHLCSDNGRSACSSDSETTDDEGGDQEVREEGGDQEERPGYTSKLLASGSPPYFNILTVIFVITFDDSCFGAVKTVREQSCFEHVHVVYQKGLLLCIFFIYGTQ